MKIRYLAIVVEPTTLTETSGFNVGLNVKLVRNDRTTQKQYKI